MRRTKNKSDDRRQYCLLPTAKSAIRQDISQGEFMTKRLPGGLVHKVPSDLIDALTQTNEIAGLWENLTPIARNEFICWVEDAKQEKTRIRRVRRTVEELLEGKRRPCCWPGCIHRTDKKPGKWQQDVLLGKKSKTR